MQRRDGRADKRLSAIWTFLPTIFLDGREWMALRQLAFGACAGAVSRPLREKLSKLKLIEADSARIALTPSGRAILALGQT
jgi:hypothetical protein